MQTLPNTAQDCARDGAAYRLIPRLWLGSSLLDGVQEMHYSARGCCLPRGAALGVWMTSTNMGVVSPPRVLVWLEGWGAEVWAERCGKHPFRLTDTCARIKFVLLSSRRVVRKSSGPAPTAPLPPLPPSCAAPNSRRPLTHKFNHFTSQSQSNLQNPNLVSLTSPDFTASLLKAMNTPPASPLEGGALGAPFQLAGDGYRIDEDMKENWDMGTSLISKC